MRMMPVTQLFLSVFRSRIWGRQRPLLTGTYQLREALQFHGGAPRATYTPSTMNPRGFDPVVDISTTPVQTGQYVRLDFLWNYRGNAQETLGVSGTRFTLLTRDIKGRVITANYAIP
jgi:hypothetical protein